MTSFMNHWVGHRLSHLRRNSDPPCFKQMNKKRRSKMDWFNFISFWFTAFLQFLVPPTFMWNLKPFKNLVCKNRGRQQGNFSLSLSWSSSRQVMTSFTTLMFNWQDHSITFEDWNSFVLSDKELKRSSFLLPLAFPTNTISYQQDLFNSSHYL